MKEKEYRRNLFIGWIGAFFMWLGDLSLSLIAACLLLPDKWKLKA